jgi:hypothetical protein
LAQQRLCHWHWKRLRDTRWRGWLLLKVETNSQVDQTPWCAVRSWLIFPWVDPRHCRGSHVCLLGLRRALTSGEEEKPTVKHAQLIPTGFDDWVYHSLWVTGLYTSLSRPFSLSNNKY